MNVIELKNTFRTFLTSEGISFKEIRSQFNGNACGLSQSSYFCFNNREVRISDHEGFHACECLSWQALAVVMAGISNNEFVAKFIEENSSKDAIEQADLAASLLAKKIAAFEAAGATKEEAEFLSSCGKKAFGRKVREIMARENIRDFNKFYSI